MRAVETDTVPAWIRLTAPIVRRLPAGRYRAMNLLCRHPPAPFIASLPAELGGYAFHCDLRDAIMREVCFTGRYEPVETTLVRAVLQPGMTFVDVGANWGYFTMLAAQRVGREGRVVGLEPDPRLFEVLRDNVRRNGLAQVTALPIAAADKPGALVLRGFDESAGNFGLSRIGRGPDRVAPAFEVQARPLDDVLAELGVDTVDLLKMDIEGFEAFALAGLQKALAERRVRRLLLELHPLQLAEHGQAPRAVVERLRDCDYRALTLDHSPAGTRRAAYAKNVALESALKPFDPKAPLDAWPHLLWLRPGEEDPRQCCS